MAPAAFPAAKAVATGGGEGSLVAVRYLALVWTQATTTWQWPATERWIALVGGKPPAPWLPRSQWHLCWLLHDPDDADHRRALDEALGEGLGDAERPQIAAHLRELFPALDASTPEMP
ncbi:MAG: hypothetical protein GY856_20865 [bacterium]|nr:hypothetical protein [bacterium]